MTGFGDARRQNERLSVVVEVRAVNNRYLKISTRTPESYAAFENDIERVVRDQISRGSVYVTIRARRHGGESQYALDEEVLAQYWKELRALSERFSAAAPADFTRLLELPGVVVERTGTEDRAGDWPLLREALDDALARLQEFRQREGQSMADELRQQCGVIRRELDKVAALASRVVEDYRDRLHERVRELLAQADVSIQPSDLIREVSIFAERADVNEEITRLRSHLEQFDAFLSSKESLGRKLEFLTQEMFREVNTTGSKANNVEIAHAVVEMKAAVEKMREILQNVE